MKLIIEVEVSPDEIPLATELLKTLRTLTDHVRARDSSKNFPALVAKLEDATQLDVVSAEITGLLTDSSNSNADTVFKDFLKSFMAVVFDKDLILRQKSVVPFMYLLPRLPEPIRNKMRDQLIPAVLKHLTVRRPVEASRADFFAHAEAFAALVSLEFVSITGAVTTIVTLLKKPENRCAAVTMLGKTVELCLQQLTEKCDPPALSDLSNALRGVTEPAFQYDINYIEESMGWTRGSDTVGSAGDGSGSKHALSDASSGGGGPLRALDSYMGHRSTIFAMCYDVQRQQLVSGGKDGSLIVWTAAGQAAETLTMPRHYACSMDIHPVHQTLLVCGVAKEDPAAAAAGRGPPAPCIACYEPVGRGWKEKGILSKEASKLVSCIRAMGQGSEHAFVTGETTAHGGLNGANARLRELVCYYDINAAPSLGALQPVRTYAEHDDLITCVSLFPPHPNIFMSGSRDFTVRVWDRRVERSVGQFGQLNKAGQVQAHEAMITCLDASADGTILSAGMDTRVLRWDFRSMGQTGSGPVAALQLDDSAVLKVALGGGPATAAVSTLRGLYLVDFEQPRGSQARLAEGFPDNRRVGRYHDLKWAHGRKTLFAAGDDMRVDLYTNSNHFN